MLLTTEQILQSALALASDERFQLIEALIAADQIQPAFDESWRAVIQKRSEELACGAVPSIPWSEVRQRLRRQVGLDG